MGKTIRLKRGHDILLEGSAVKVLGQTPEIRTYALKPADNHGIKPKVLAKEGTEVKAGTPIFYDKNNEQAMFCSPVSGEIAEVVRGEKRKLLEIRILADKEISYEDLGTKANIDDLDADQIVESLLKSGAWPMIRKRPFAKVANPEERPKSIFISGFDSAPLAPDYNFIMEGQDELFQAGINVLRKLTDGPVHLNLKEGEKQCSAYSNVNGVEVNYFDGPHPSGTVGVQIHHLDPIRKGDVVWYVNPQDVITIAKVFTEGKFDPERTVAVCGNEFFKRKYYKTRLGAPVAPFIKGNTKDNGTIRFVSGSPLFGTSVEEDGFFSFWDCQLSSMHERDYPEFQGWLMPSYKRPTVSRAFPWAMEKATHFVATTSMHGEERAFIVTGEYEKVLPMDIYPVYLIKEIMAENVEAMEGLGIYEVTEEELALCEFACTSKIPVTDYIRKGLEIIEREG